MLSSRKLKYGTFINDAKYVTKKQVTIDGKFVFKTCPIFSVWSHMVDRCASEKLKDEHITYLDVTCCLEWVHFSNFKAWMEIQPFTNCQLDKDILVKGNTVYSPETCCFVPARINSLLVDRKNGRGESNLLGVSWHKGAGKYTASIRVMGQSKHLGYFSNPLEAHKAWQKAKAIVLVDAVDWWRFSAQFNHSFRDDVAEALWYRANTLITNSNNGVVTESL